MCFLAVCGKCAVHPGVLDLCNLYFIRKFVSCLKCLNTVVEKSSKYDWLLHWLVSSPDISDLSRPFRLCLFANILWKYSGYSRNQNKICPFLNSYISTDLISYLVCKSNWGSCVIILIHQKWKITWEHTRFEHFNLLSILILSSVAFWVFFLELRQNKYLVCG